MLKRRIKADLVEIAHGIWIALLFGALEVCFWNTIRLFQPTKLVEDRQGERTHMG